MLETGDAPANQNPVISLDSEVGAGVKWTFSGEVSQKTFIRRIQFTPQTLDNCTIPPVTQDVEFQIIDVDIKEA